MPEFDFKTRKENDNARTKQISRNGYQNAFNDTVQHNKPHVHVSYGEYKASVGIDGELLAGSLPQKQFKMLVGWLALHEEEAYAAWNKAVRGEHFDKITPLQ